MDKISTNDGRFHTFLGSYVLEDQNAQALWRGKGSWRFELHFLPWRRTFRESLVILLLNLSLQLSDSNIEIASSLRLRL